MTSTSMTDRSATVMMTVGEKLWAPMTVSPSSFWRFVTTPSMVETMVVFSRSSRLEASRASCWLIRRFCASTAAAFIFSSASDWSKAWSEMSFSACILFWRSKARRDTSTSASARARSALAPSSAAADCRSPAAIRVESMRASTWPFFTVSPSLTSNCSIRPETLALMLT